MVCKVNCAAITGIEVKPVLVETDVCNGLPVFDMVGLLSSDTKEARERVRTAIKNSGFMVPPKRITINLSPGNIRKAGTYFDLPIAVSILLSAGILQTNVKDSIFVGELSLNGDVVKVNGVLPIVLHGIEQGMKQCFVPKDNLGECGFLKNIKVVGVSNLNELVRIISKGVPENYDASNMTNLAEKSISYPYDFKSIKGQIQGKKAAEIAAAGFHNLLMSGPPGSGKTLIAKAMPSILPEMSMEEKIQISKIQSIAGLLNGKLIGERPFRNPHHTTTISSMAGGGIVPKPGEITLAHGGILFLDEFPEFSRKVLETLRQPLEDRKVVISRNGGKYEFPADMILVAAMNPCKCGYFPDRNRCNCTEREVEKYLGKISGPIVDRFDLCVNLNRVEYKEILDSKLDENSDSIRKRVHAAVSIQKERFEGTSILYNGQLEGKMIKEFCYLNKKEQHLMEQVFDKFDLSMRSYGKVIKVARTIADINEHKNIDCSDIYEALTFRTPKWM